MMIEISQELRPCVDTQNNERLLFHHWIYGDIALCEKEDGTMTQRGQSIIKFLDGKHKEYIFTDHPTEKGGEGK